MRTVVKTIRKAARLTGMSALVAWSGSVTATPLTLPDSPLFLSAGVQPNLIMAIDDSGSMDFEVLFRGNDGAAWWRMANASGNCAAADGNSFVGCIADGTTDQPAAGRLNFNNAGNPDGTWKKYSYLFPNGCDSLDTSAQRRLCDNTNDHFAIPPLRAYAWARAFDYNAAYFNPAKIYLPWPSEGGYTFTDSDPTNARFDPVFNSAQVINLTRDVAGIGSTATTSACDNSQPTVGGNYYFHVYQGMTLPEGTCMRRPTGNWEVVRTAGCAIGATNGCYTHDSSTNTDLLYSMTSDRAVAIRYFPATFYLTSAADLPTDYGYTGATLTGTAPDGTSLIGYEIKPGNFDTTAHYTAALQNFANWFTYYRKRHQALRGGMGQSFATLGGMRVAGFTINNSAANVTMRDINVAANRTALYTNFYRDWIRSGGTPNRNAVANVLRNFRRTDLTAPVQYSCQKNFGILFTDGFSNPPATGDGITGIGNLDGGAGAPYADNVSDTMADAVYGGYVNTLRTGTGFPAGKVNVPTTCSGSSPDPKVDCNRNLHMNFYAVTLGTRGLQFDPDADPAQDPYATQPTWPTAFPARHPSAVDDLWHSTVNGRGQLLNAKSPGEISEKLSAVLRSIIEKTASASSASVNSGSINSDTRIFQAKFNSANWTGQLLSYRLNTANGDLITPEDWDASDELPAPALRNIVTLNTNGTAVPFEWASLDATRQSQLDAVPATAQQVLDYVRGDGSNEGTGTGRFRVRQDAEGPNKLGDIVSSSPLFVGRPNFRYRDSLESARYSTFASTNVNRQGVVYAGANDGMLHAFDAEQGNEIFAFIPSPVFARLRNLTSQSYAHQFFVDGPPSMGDVFYNGAWHTVLVGGLNKGGQGIYALNITNPSSLGTSSVLWEFTDANDADLGLTFSQPSIVKLRNGRWAAVFGNGYNSRVTDTYVSSTGNAVLYIVDIETGALIRKLDTGAGTAQAPTGVTWDNGLSTPALVDTNGDRIVEYAYAGDLYGNMWKFDLSSTDSASWSVAFAPSGTPAPLYRARDALGNAQPITVRPEVTRGPFGSGMVVLFGTGKYLEAEDKQTTAPQKVQTFYGVVDRNTGTDSDRVSDRTSLTAQQILVETSVDPDGGGPLTALNIRVTSNNTLNGSSGWYLDLVSPTLGYQAEKQVSNPIVRNGRVIFTTLLPDSDPCSSGGGSWIMEINALDGSRLTATPFDVNNDSQFTNADNVTVTLPDGSQVTVPISGLGSKEGILQSPGVIEGEVQGGLPVQFKYLPGSSGGIQRVTENPGTGGTGRQSWRQIR
jgi:type IV pilus assembly protein PilY1